MKMDIFEAAKSANLTHLKQHLSEGADVNGVNNDGDTALFIACVYNNVNIVEYLLSQGADTEIRAEKLQWTPLLMASEQGCQNNVKALLKHGAKIDDQDELGESALYKAASHGHQDVVSVLIQNKADIEVRRYMDQTTPLFVAAQKGHIQVVQMLIKAGANLESKEKTKRQTPVMMALKMNHLAVVDVLYQAGADINVTDGLGFTALHWAANSESTNQLQAVLKYSPTLSKNNLAETALDIAKKKGCSKIVVAIETYLKDKCSDTTTTAICREMDKNQSGMIQCVDTLEGEQKEKKNHVNEQKGSERKPNGSVDVAMPLRKLKIRKRVENVEKDQSLPLQQEAKDSVTLIGKMPDLENPPQDLGNEHLFRIAKRVGKMWKQLAACLGRDLQEIQRIQSENPNDDVFSTWSMLIHWRDDKSSIVETKKEVLIRAVKEVDRIDLVPYI